MDFFNFPKEWLKNRYLAKEKVYTHIPTLTEKRKKLFVQCVESIRIMYVIDMKNSRIPEYVSEEKSYKEIDVLQVEMRNIEKSDDILKLLHVSIPKSTVIVLQYKSEQCISIADKIIMNNGKVKLDAMYTSMWRNHNDELWQSLDYTTYERATLRDIYQSICKRIRIHNICIQCEMDRYLDHIDWTMDKVSEIEQINEQIRTLQTQRNKDNQLNRIAILQEELTQLFYKRDSLLK